MAKRQSERPDRRIAPTQSLSTLELDRILRSVRYVGTAYHKSRPADYGFHPPADPRPWKSLCDDKRTIRKDEAISLLRSGIDKGMVSLPKPGQVPKYVWAVDDDGEVYEAKTDPAHGAAYHGYRLGDDERQMRMEVLTEWARR